MCADCAARTREAWQLPASSRPSTPRAGIPWATAAVSLAAAAVIFGIVVGPVERAVSPRSPAPPSVVAEFRSPAPGRVIAQNPPAQNRAPQSIVKVDPTVVAAFGPGDKRGFAGAGSAARSRVSRARARVTAPGHYPSMPAPEPPQVLIASLAEVDAEWSPSVLAVAPTPADVTPAALPQIVAARPIESQAP